MSCFHILAWYIVLEKKSLIKNSILNVTPDFIFHLWFYCFSPCPLSLTHLLHVFNPHLKLSFVSLLFCKSSSEVSVPTQHPLKIVHVECSPSCYLLSVMGSPYCPYRASGWAAGLIRNFITTFLPSSWGLFWCHEELKGDGSSHPARTSAQVSRAQNPWRAEADLRPDSLASRWSSPPLCSSSVI